MFWYYVYQNITVYPMFLATWHCSRSMHTGNRKQTHILCLNIIWIQFYNMPLPLDYGVLLGTLDYGLRGSANTQSRIDNSTFVFIGWPMLKHWLSTRSSSHQKVLIKRIITAKSSRRTLLGLATIFTQYSDCANLRTADFLGHKFKWQSGMLCNEQWTTSLLLLWAHSCLTVF